MPTLTPKNIPMNILYLIAMYGPQYLGNLIHREIGEEFVRRGHTFQVFTLASAREHVDIASQRAGDGIEVHRALAAGRALPDALNALTKPLLHYDRFGAGWWYLSRFLAQHRDLDLILAESAYPFGAMAALAAYGWRKPPRAPRLLITVAGGDFIASRATCYGYGRFRTARALTRYAFRNADAVRVTTPLVREHVLALGATPEQIALVPRNIAAYCFPPGDVPLEAYRARARAELRARLGLGDAHLIAAVGRLLPIKGFDKLLDALPNVIREAGDTRLLLIGPNRVDSQFGDYQAHLQQLAHGRGIAARVLFTGAVPHEQMRDYLAAVDVIAVPSVLEGMNKVAVEAAAVGTPAAVTRTAGIADWVAETRSGLVVEEGSPDALAGGLIQLLCNESLRAEMGARGVIAARAFSSSVVGERLIELCEKICDYDSSIRPAHRSPRHGL